MHRRRRARCGRATATSRRRARPGLAGLRRVRALPATSRQRGRSDPDPDRAGRRSRSDHRPRAGSRRLRHEAVLPARARGAGARRPAADRSVPGGSRVDRRRRRAHRPAQPRGHRRRIDCPSPYAGVRAAGRARATRRPGCHTRLPARPCLGAVVCRRHAHGRRPRGAAPQEARPAGSDSDGSRRRLSHPRGVISLRTRLWLAIGASVLAGISLSSLVAAYLVRRSLEQNAFSGLQRQVALLAHQDVHPAPGQFGRFLATQDERLSVLAEEQARLLLPDKPTGRITINGRDYLYATKASGDDIVVLLRTASSVRAESRPFWVALAAAGGIGCLLAAAVAAVLARSIARPVLKVARATSRLAEG